ncbi:MAG: D-alanyl-D-alanine carboxypeptidase/D-alanyl-D-alanine-endopeptidase [Armatimonadia bacterium]|nr:D-alanyl-D-alanine carboxypeptidase/D-alanyl-D-alanine-endopeptidase [Armatimonadia bacterium]
MHRHNSALFRRPVLGPRTRSRSMRRFARCGFAVTIAATGLLILTGLANAESLRAVQSEIAGLLAHPALRGAEVGALVVSSRGDGIYRLCAETPLIPASNMKLVTVATALELLGPDYDCSQMPGAHEAESLGTLARRILKPSDNALADTLLAELPMMAGRPDLAPDQLCAEAWGDRGLHLQGTCWADGSGLSRRDMMSAEVIVGLLEAMDGSQYRQEFITALPIAGVDGTLRRRMRGGPAQGRVRAKTGTLTGVSALSGYAETDGGERLTFAMVMNGFACDKERVRRIQDEVCAALVELDREAEGSERAEGD